MAVHGYPWGFHFHFAVGDVHFLFIFAPTFWVSHKALGFHKDSSSCIRKHGTHKIIGQMIVQLFLNDASLHIKKEVVNKVQKLILVRRSKNLEVM